MQNNLFEKRVKQKMDELKLLPSAGVWNRVEAVLPKERKRRWLIFFLLFAFIATGSLLWLNSGQEPEKNTSQLPIQKNNIALIQEKTNNNAEPPINEINKTQDANTAEPADHSVAPVLIANTNKSRPNPNVSNTSNSNITAISPSPVDKTVYNKSGKVTISAEDPLSENADLPKTYREKYLEQPSVLAALAKIKISIQSPDMYEENKKTLVEKNSIEKNNPVSTMANVPVITAEEKKDQKEVETAKARDKEKVMTDSLRNGETVKVPNKKKKQPWQYSIQFGAGIPYTRNGINSTVFTSSVSSFAAAPTVNNPIYNQPASPSPGKVFQTGITIEKNIAGKLDIKTGLSYMYLSNHIKIGAKIDSLSGNGISTYDNDNGFLGYGNNNPNFYNNYFRFIQLPLVLQLNVLKKDQFSVFLEGGASLDYIASSNALLFNAETNTYSTGKNFFNRMVYTGIGGIGAKVAQQTKIPVALGYQFSYGMKPFFKNTETQKHLPISLVYFRLYLKR